MSRLMRAIKGLFRRDQMERELDSELRFHLEREIEKNLERGMTPAQASREAKRRFGGFESIKEQSRNTRGVSFLETAWQDVRYGGRVLIKNPGFTIVAIVALALGIGADSAVFSVLNSVILKPLPFKDPSRIMNIGEINPSHGSDYPLFSPGNFIELEKTQKSFESVMTMFYNSVKYTSDGDNETWPTLQVTQGFFPTLGVAPLIGRVFTSADMPANAPATAILSYRLWQRKFAGDPAILGRSLLLDKKPYSVIGVMPSGFRSPMATDYGDLWVPLPANNAQFNDHSDRYIRVYGRLSAGATQAQAQNEMNVIASRLAQDFPDTNKGWTIRVTDLAEDVTGDIRSTLLILFAAGCCVLLVACANVANLLLARASARKRELSIRAALGASRARLIRQVLTESVLLSVTGGLLGAGLALWSVKIVRELKPRELPRLDELTMDWRVLLFTFAASVLAGCACGAISGWLSTRAEVAGSLKDGGSQTSGGVTHARVRSLLIVAELSLSLVLLVSAGLLIRSFYRMTHENPGFDSHGILTTTVGASFTKNPTFKDSARFYEQFIERVRSIPGIESAALVTAAPLTTSPISFPFSVKGQSLGNNEKVRTVLDAITPDFLKTLAIPLKAGRNITDQDRYGGHGVALVNETLAHCYFGANDKALGREIEFIFLGRPISAEIVGVVGDTKRDSLAESIQASVYLPEYQVPWFYGTLVARTRSSPMDYVRPVQQALHELDADQELSKPITMDEAISKSVAQPRFYSLLFGAFAAIAVILASVGLYGVISYMTGQRTHEIGIRVALGAQRSDVVKLVLSQGMTLVAIGVILGLGGALAASRLLSKLLYGVSTVDLISYLSVSVLLGLVALLACYIPARRATKVDPLVALRYD